MTHDIDHERWKRVNRILGEAMDLDGDRREEFLDRECSGDANLRAQVETLLDAERDTDDFLELPVGELATDLVRQGAEVDRGTDEQFAGKYRIMRKVGEGGMGEVYEAQQLEPVRRRVALKVIKAGMDTRSVIARFESERQALALMNHPSIARVYDAGATEKLRPFFAMEYVKGVPITKHCDTHRLGTSERLELFIQVCEGVQHAHQKGVIHRDIKPSNVLVMIQNEKSLPKIIDFGVAKATGLQLTEKTFLTELGQVVGTPEYMSPEQAEMTGQDIDTRTDVYSLGVLLYELLVGELPFEPGELRLKGLDEFRRRIRETEPPKPSTRLSGLGPKSIELAKRRQIDPAALRRRLRGDLDWIVMRALEKDRTRRYGSPAELAADVRRHLAHQPVLAGPPSTIYSARKFVRRHTAGVALTIAATLVLLAFALTMTIQAGRVSAERDRANREAEAKGEVANFLKGLFEVSDPSEARGNSITARELLDTGARRIDDMLVEQPEVQAELMATMGEVYRKLGLYPQAEPLLERVLATRKELLGDEHPDTLETQNELAVLYDEEGRHNEAEPLFSRTLEVRSRVLGDDHPKTLDSQSHLAVLYARQGRYDKAEPLFRDTFEMQRDLLGQDDPQTLLSSNNLAGLYWRQGRFDEAEPLYRRTLEAQQRVLGDDHPNTLLSMNNLAGLCSSQGRYDEAEPLFIETLETRRRVLGEEHPETLQSWNSLALLYDEQGRYDEAEPLFRKTLETQRRVLGADHPDTLVTQTNLANLHLHLDRPDEAERLYRKTLETQRRIMGNQHPATALSLYNLACLESVRGDRLRAMDWLGQAVEAGYANADGMMRDHDLERLHGSEFDALVGRARKNAAAQRAG